MVRKRDVAREIPFMLADWLRRLVPFIVAVIGVGILLVALFHVMLWATRASQPAIAVAADWLLLAWLNRPWIIDAAIQTVLMLIAIWFYGSLALYIWRAAAKRVRERQ